MNYNNADLTFGKGSVAENIERLKKELASADAVVIGAGKGLSESAGLVYTGERLEQCFGDFANKYHFIDMYEGGFCPFDTLEEKWAYWSRYIYINRYMRPSGTVYDMLYELVDGRNKGDIASEPKKDYYVMTTNIDHQFQKAGFAKRRMFCMQGDFGHWQCSKPCHKRIYDNKDKVIKMLIAQGFSFDEDGKPVLPSSDNGRTDYSKLSMAIPSELVPYCPVCGEPMSMNIRMGNTFVEDEGFYEASDSFKEFLDSYEGQHILFLELGVGNHTPDKIKYPFWQMTHENVNAVYACINDGESCCPKDIEERSICINGDIGEILKQL